MNNRVTVMVSALVGVAFGFGCLAEARSEPPAGEPRTLQECYLKVAMGKSTADMAYVAREICDALFKPARRSLFVLDGKSATCVEWWFDQRGRYESPLLQCAMEAAGPDTWTLACQHKDAGGRVTLIELADRHDKYERVGTLIGVDPGPIFKTLAQCVRARAGK